MEVLYSFINVIDDAIGRLDIEAQSLLASTGKRSPTNGRPDCGPSRFPENLCRFGNRWVLAEPWAWCLDGWVIGTGERRGEHHVIGNRMELRGEKQEVLVIWVYLS